MASTYFNPHAAEYPQKNTSKNLGVTLVALPTTIDKHSQ